MPHDDPANLEFTTDEMRAMGRDTLERAIAHIASLAAQPICGDIDAAPDCRDMREPSPEDPSELGPLLDNLFDDWIPRSFTPSGPGYLAFIPGGGLFPAALADLIADTTNRFTGIWQAAPALVQLEANVLDWFRSWMGFPEETRGLLTTGGSMATFNAVLCARERLLGPDIRRGVVYASSEAHHSIRKAAKLAGVMPDRVRTIPVDGRLAMRVDALEEAVARDLETGLTPFLVVSSAGTVNTGTIDPLDTVADLSAREGLWHHVDGAYGAFFRLCDELRPRLSGIERADSLTLDPHKGLFLPYGTGALLVRDGSALRAVHAGSASYLPELPDPDECYDPSQHGPDLSRGFPGLRVWLCVKLLGTAALRAAITEKRVLALEAADAIGRVPGISLTAPPDLSLFAFRLSRPGGTPEQGDDATRALIDRVRDRGRFMMTGATVHGRFSARVCILSFRTRRTQMEDAVRQIAEEAAEILGPSPGA